VVLPLGMVLMASSCYVSTDYGLYPQGKLVEDASLIRDWKGGGAELGLRERYTFSAAGLTLEYFECLSEGIQ
jgi:hypothetical protein